MLTGALAVLLRRADLLYVTAPLLVATALALVRRPTSVPTAEVRVTPDVPTEGDRIALRVEVRSPRGADLVAVTAVGGPWLRTATGRPTSVVTRPDEGGHTDVEVPLTAARWGRHPTGETVVIVLGADGLLRAVPPVGGGPVLRVLPRIAGFRGVAELPQARGGIGVHRSRRPGDGTELSGVREFRPGDRLRRINWRVSQRADRLYVNATVAERDAEVLLLLDGRYDAGTSGGVDGTASGTDVGVRAAAALARFYLELGDRVRLLAQGERVLAVPAAGGRRQLLRVLDALLDLRSPRVRTAEPDLVEPVGLDPRALVILLSPLVGIRAHERAAALARRGHPLVVVDTLPDDAAPPDPGRWTPLALRIWRLRRAGRTLRLQELGVPVVPWRGPGSLDVVLRDLARIATVPRVRR